MPPRKAKKTVSRTCECPALVKRQKLKLRKERKQLDYDRKQFELEMAGYVVWGPKLLMKLRRLEAENTELKKENTALDKEAMHLRGAVEDLTGSVGFLRDALTAKHKNDTVNGQQPSHPSKGPPRFGSRIRKKHVDLSNILHGPLNTIVLPKQNQQDTNETTTPEISPEHPSNNEALPDRFQPNVPPTHTANSSPGKPQIEPSTDRPSRIRNTIGMLNNIKNKNRLSESSSNESEVSSSGLTATAATAATAKPQQPKAVLKSSPAKSIIQPSPSKTTKTTALKSSGVKKTIFKKAPANAAKTKTRATDRKTPVTRKIRSVTDTAAGQVEYMTPEYGTSSTTFISGATGKEARVGLTMEWGGWRWRRKGEVMATLKIRIHGRSMEIFVGSLY